MNRRQVSFLVTGGRAGGVVGLPLLLEYTDRVRYVPPPPGIGVAIAGAAAGPLPPRYVPSGGPIPAAPAPIGVGIPAPLPGIPRLRVKRLLRRSRCRLRRECLSSKTATIRRHVTPSSPSGVVPGAHL